MLSCEEADAEEVGIMGAAMIVIVVVVVVISFALYVIDTSPPYRNLYQWVDEVSL